MFIGGNFLKSKTQSQLILDRWYHLKLIEAQWSNMAS